MNALSKTKRMSQWYEEMIFLTEVIAKIYSYMATRKRDKVEDAFQMLGKRYRLRFVPIGRKK